MGRSIAIAGNIGAGKSTLVEFLATQYGVRPFYEPNDENPYLADFYRDMQRWAFQSQIYFLGTKFRMHRELDCREGVVALDRTIFEDAEIFATALYRMGKLSAREWDTYQALYAAILDTIRTPDLLIYLRCSMRTLRRRIRLRGRSMEQDIPLAYLKRLERLYEEWVTNWDRSEVLVIDTDRLDYVQDLVHRLDVMQRIEAVLPEGLTGDPGGGAP